MTNNYSGQRTFHRRRINGPVFAVFVSLCLAFVGLVILIGFLCGRAFGQSPKLMAQTPEPCLVYRTTMGPLGTTTGCVYPLLPVPAPAPSLAHYRTHDAALLNDLEQTPGDVGPMTTAQLCDPKFHTGTVRNVPQSRKRAVCASYGVARANCNGKLYEIDHLISLELGGSNDLRNLWPQPYAPTPAAHEKDVVEDWLHAQVCKGAMPLADAQKAIATDWYAVWAQLNNASPIQEPIGAAGQPGAVDPPVTMKRAGRDGAAGSEVAR